MQIKFYKYYCRDNRVNKQNFFSQSLPEITLNGELREATNLINPQILITMDNNISYADLLLCNYVYIPLFYRYYFIRDIELTRKDLITISLHVDVLTSHFVEVYKNASLNIKRATNGGNKFLFDDRRGIKLERSVTIHTITNVINGLKNITFDTNPDITILDAYTNIAFTTIPTYGSDTVSILGNSISASGYISYQTPDLGTNYKASNNIVGGLTTTSLRGFITTVDEISYVLSNGIADDTIASFIGNIYAYPFNIVNYVSHSGVFGNVKAGEDVLTKGGAGNVLALPIYNFLSKRLVLNDFMVDLNLDINDFTDLTPYAQYQLYLPFYGFYELNVNEVRGHRLLIFYVVNFINNTAVVTLHDKTVGHDLFTAPVQLGVELTKSTTNIREVLDRQKANQMNLVLNSMSSVISLGLGVATGNPLAVVGGSMGLTKTIAGTIQNEMTNYKRANIQLLDDLTNLVSPIEAFIIKTKPQLQYPFNDTKFLNENGTMVNKWIDSVYLNQYYGYIEFNDIIYKGNETDNTLTDIIEPTTEELKELIDICKKGIYIPNNI